MNLADPGTLRAFLGRHGIRAEKGLGQHFLVSKKVVDRIVGALEGVQGVLEIGPGPGVLTAPLSSGTRRVVALETDARMIEALRESAPHAEVICADALKADYRRILQALPSPRGLVSNLPYYITGPLLTRIAEARDCFDLAVLMMQREVAERVTAEPRTPGRGSLSVYLQAQFEIRTIARVSAGAFMPPPKVDSAVLTFVPKAAPVPAYEESAFFRLVRVGFTQPRKTLVNNLVPTLARENAMLAVAAAGLGERARPQELVLDEWVALHHAVANLTREQT